MTKYASNLIPERYVDIHSLISKQWGEDTSANGTFNPETPERGQCAVTALIVQDIYGGVLLRTLVNGESHYWNEIDGEEVDFTRAQFETPLTFAARSTRDRDYLFTNASTVKRYEILKNRISHAAF